MSANAVHAAAAPLLEVAGLSVTFSSEAGPVSAVRSLSYQIRKGEVLGIVGESGSGKTVSSLAIMELLPRNARVTGSVRFQGTKLIGRSDRMRANAPLIGTPGVVDRPPTPFLSARA